MRVQGGRGWNKRSLNRVAGPEHWVEVGGEM